MLGGDEHQADPVDAILLVSFGGPEGRDDVLPFLERVLEGRNVPQQRLLEVAEHYFHFDGVSPINEQNRQLLGALQQLLEEEGPDLPIYWGNRNWHPLLPDVVAHMAEDGVQRALAFVTSAFGSASGCRQYLGDIERAREVVGSAAPRIDKLRLFFNHPRFLSAVTDRARDAIGEFDGVATDEVHVVFTAHSIPTSMATCCPYEEQLRESGRLVAEALGTPHWDLVYQSRSGRPEHPWLEPDVCDHLRALHAAGNRRPILLIPLGFLSDHMEVLYDLDVEAREVANELGQRVARASAPGCHPDLVAMIRDLVLEQVTPGAERAGAGSLAPAPDRCAPDCCRSTVDRP